MFDPLKKLLKIKSPVFVPEIKLYSVVPQEETYPFQPTEFNCMYGYPTWSGISVARFILDNKEKFSNLSITDFGSGSGVASIAAAMAGANVAAIDRDVASVYFTDENAKLNDVNLNVVWGNFYNIETEYVIISSLFYDTDNHANIKHLINTKKVIIGNHLPDGFNSLNKIKLKTSKELYIHSNFLGE